MPPRESKAFLRRVDSVVRRRRPERCKSHKINIVLPVATYLRDVPKHLLRHPTFKFGTARLLRRGYGAPKESHRYRKVTLQTSRRLSAPRHTAVARPAIRREDRQL